MPVTVVTMVDVSEAVVVEASEETTLELGRMLSLEVTD